MKKIAVFLGLVIFLCGCSNSANNVKPVLSGITFTAKINFYNEQFLCEGAISEQGALVLTVIEPDNISGMKFSVEETGITAEYKGLYYTPNSGTLPFGGVASDIFTIITDAKRRMAPASKKNDGFCIESAKDEKYYKITIAQTGLPLSIEYPYHGLKVDFNNTTIKK